MKLLHVQIVAGVMAVGCIGSALGLMTTVAKKRDAERKLQTAEADLAAARGGKGAVTTPKKATGPSVPAAPGAEFAAGRIKALEGEVKRVEAALRQAMAENEDLKKQLAGGKAVPGSAYGQGAPPPEIVVGGRDLAPPPPPGDPQTDGNNPWGAAEDSQLDEMAAVIKLDVAQREETKKIILDGQNEFERLLIEASKGGERDITAIEKIGEQVSKKTQARIEQLLREDQKGAFREYIRKQEEVK